MGWGVVHFVPGKRIRRGGCYFFEEMSRREERRAEGYLMGGMEVKEWGVGLTR